MSSTTLSNAIEQSHDAAVNAVADIKPHLEKARSAVGDHKDQFMSAAHDAYGAARKQGRQLASQAGGYYDSARDYTADGVRSAVNAARGHPLSTVAIAAGVGLLFGAFLMLGRRR